MKKKLRIAFMIASILGWAAMGVALSPRVSSATGGVIWMIALPVAIGFGIAAFALKGAKGPVGSRS